MRGQMYMSAVRFAENIAHTVEQRSALPVSWILRLFPGGYSASDIEVWIGSAYCLTRSA